MDGGCWLAGWTCNERATMLYALYVLYVRVCAWMSPVQVCAKCWGCYAMLWACSALCLALRLARKGSDVMQCR